MAAYLAGLAAVTAFFLLDPGVDLAVSHFFYRPGVGFYLSGSPLVRFVYHAVPLLTRVLAVLLVAGSAYAWWRRDRVSERVRRVLLYLIVGLVLAPGLLTNTLFKDHWGRARPRDVAAFGGAKAFTPPVVISHQCDHNCSFPSGHAAMAFFLVAFAFVERDPARRRWIFAGAVLAGLLVGLVRIVQGAHFLSDVIYSGFLDVGVLWVLARWIVAGPT